MTTEQGGTMHTKTRVGELWVGPHDRLWEVVSVLDNVHSFRIDLWQSGNIVERMTFATRDSWEMWCRGAKRAILPAPVSADKTEVQTAALEGVRQTLRSQKKLIEESKQIAKGASVCTAELEARVHRDHGRLARLEELLAALEVNRDTKPANVPVGKPVSGLEPGMLVKSQSTGRGPWTFVCQDPDDPINAFVFGFGYDCLGEQMKTADDLSYPLADLVPVEQARTPRRATLPLAVFGPLLVATALLATVVSGVMWWALFR